MGKSISYEIYTFKNGDWMLDSVHDDKAMAIHQGRMLIASPHHMAIRVVEESYDDVADQSFSKIIYKEEKGRSEKPPVKQAAAKKKKARVPAKKKKKKDDYAKNVIVLILGVTALGIGSLALVVLLISKFG